MTKILDIQNVGKVYAGGKEALTNVNLSVEEGEFLALLGPNGAGKTTLINSLIGNVKKTSGEIYVGGMDADKNPIAVKKMLGIVPQEISYDGFFTVSELLHLQRGYFGLKQDQDYINELLEALSLTDKAHAPPRSLSGGMKRRLMIARALVHRPKLFILDEPTAGVDLELRQSLYVFLEKLHAEGMTMILTTHYLEEAERLCDRIVVINKGEIVADGGKTEMIQKLGHAVDLTVEGSGDESVLAQWNAVRKGEMVHFRVEKSDLAKALLALGEGVFDLQKVQIREPNLEDVFLNLVGQK